MSGGNDFVPPFFRCHPYFTAGVLQSVRALSVARNRFLTRGDTLELTTGRIVSGFFRGEFTQLGAKAPGMISVTRSVEPKVVEWSMFRAAAQRIVTR